MFKHLVSLVFTFAIVVFSGSAVSVTLTLVPSSQTINISETATADLLISGLGEFASPSLGAFDIELIFDDSIFAFNSESFGSLLGTSIQGVDTSTPGVAGLYEVSLEGVSTLDALQPGSILLAILKFDSIGVGTSPLEFGNVVLSDAIGDVIPNPALVAANVTVVPLPTSILLFVTGLLGLSGISKRKRAALHILKIE